MNILISICARGGSKGVPGKNIKTVAGLPLIAYSIRTAQRFQTQSAHTVHIALSTDSQKIVQVAAELVWQPPINGPNILPRIKQANWMQ